MPEREEYDTDYDVPLHPLELGCWLRMRISARRGKIAGFVVQLEVQIDDRTYPVVRYDCAHGQPHRDLLDHTGAVLEKRFLAFDYDRALSEAERDIRANWRYYRAEFLRRMP